MLWEEEDDVDAEAGHPERATLVRATSEAVMRRGLLPPPPPEAAVAPLLFQVATTRAVNCWRNACGCRWSG